MSTTTKTRTLTIACTDGTLLRGDLVVPSTTTRQRIHGLVVLAHGSSNARLNPRNRTVAEHLRAGRLATLVVGLLTETEDQWAAQASAMRFDVDLLATRFGEILRHTRHGDIELAALPVALFGAGTAAAGALRAGAHHPEQVRAIVCRGRRLDLAQDDLAAIHVPVLFFAGERDRDSVDAARQAAERLGAQATVDVIPAARRLFDEPDALEAMASRAAPWLARALDPAAVSPRPSG